MIEYRYTCYAIFYPLDVKGVCLNWEDVQKLINGRTRHHVLGFWSIEQAELALTYDYPRAKEYKKELLALGLDKPKPEEPPLQYPRFEW